MSGCIGAQSIHQNAYAAAILFSVAQSDMNFCCCCLSAILLLRNSWICLYTMEKQFGQMNAVSRKLRYWEILLVSQ